MPTQTPLRLPDFLVIGAAKAGTTTVHRYLCRHSCVHMSQPKEPAFFSSDHVFQRGENWYGQLFDQARPNQLCGEASTTYTRWPHTADAAERISNWLPGAKLIYIMRNPVDRAYSHYAHHMRKGVTMTFEEALCRDQIYVDCGLYMMQIERYLDRMPRESFLFLLFDDLQSDPERVLGRIQSFLGLSTQDLTAHGRVRANATSSDYYLKAITTDRLKRLPGISGVARQMPSRTKHRVFSLVKRSPLGRRLQQRYQLAPMRSDTREVLIERFREPNKALATFLGRDLSHWAC